MRLFFAIGDFSVIDSNSRINIISIGYLIMAVGSWQFIYSMERRITPRARVYPLSTIYVILIVFIVIMFFFDRSFSQFVSALMGVPFIVMWSIYVIRIWRKASQVGRTLFFTYSTGLFGLIGGFLLTSDTVLQVTETYIVRAIGDVILVLSLIMLGYFFTKLPAWGEFTWKSKTQVIYLFYITNGLGIFEYRFNDPTPTTTSPEGGKGSVLDQDLLIPGLTSIRELLEKTSSVTEPPKTYRQDDATILLEYGQWVGAAAICTEDLHAVRRMLRRFIRQVESVYAQVLPHWHGNLTVLARVNDIFNHLIISPRTSANQLQPDEDIREQKKKPRHSSKKHSRLKSGKKATLWMGTS